MEWTSRTATIAIAAARVNKMEMIAFTARTSPATISGRAAAADFIAVNMAMMRTVTARAIAAAPDDSDDVWAAAREWAWLRDCTASRAGKAPRWDAIVYTGTSFVFESAWGFHLAGILVGSKGARIVAEGAAGIERLGPGIVAVYRPKLTPPSATWLSVLYSKSMDHDLA
jgi:hypothetical protein